MQLATCAVSSVNAGFWALTFCASVPSDLHCTTIQYVAQVMEGGRGNFPAALVGWLAYVCIDSYSRPACSTWKEILCGQGWVLSQLADDPRFSAFLVGMRYLSEPFDWPDALVLLPAGLVRRRGCKLKLPTCLQMFACGDVT